MRPYDFKQSPEDQATVARWRRGVLMFYGSIGLILVAVMTVAHVAHIAIQFASRRQVSPRSEITHHA
jgi:hypothetical protein